MKKGLDQRKGWKVEESLVDEKNFTDTCKD